MTDDKGVREALAWADASLTQRWRIVRASMPDDPDPMTDSIGARFEAMHADAMDTITAALRERDAEIEAAVRFGYVDGYADGSAAAATAPRVDRAVERYREAKRLHMLQTEDK